MIQVFVHAYTPFPGCELAKEWMGVGGAFTFSPGLKPLNNNKQFLFFLFKIPGVRNRQIGGCR